MYCNFSENLENNRLEQFISGVNLTRKLVESGNMMTLAGAIEVADTVQ